jgi:hypothetical protein
MDESPYLLPHLPLGSGERGVGLSLYPLEVAGAQMTPPARKLADALDTIRQYRQLRTVIYTDGSAAGGVKLKFVDVKTASARIQIKRYLAELQRSFK